MTRTWPADHPGRKCGRCGKEVYRLWVDDAPPPGTCPDDAPHPRQCSQVMSSLSLGYRLLRDHHNDNMHIEHERTMQRCGITMDEVKAYADRFDAMTELEGSLSYGPHKALGTAISEFLGDEAEGATLQPHDRALVLIKEIASQVSFANGERTVFEIGEMADWFIKQATDGLQSVGDWDFE